MRLSTYNSLATKAKKGIEQGHPLKLEIIKKTIIQTAFNPSFMLRYLPRMNWETIRLAAEQCDLNDCIPAEKPHNLNELEGLLLNLHHLLFEIDVIEGSLICPETGRIYPIKDGVPNMFLDEDEL